MNARFNGAVLNPPLLCAARCCACSPSPPCSRTAPGRPSACSSSGRRGRSRALADVAVEVVAPVGLPLWPLSLHPHYACLRALPARETRNGLAVHRPRYRVWPRLGQGRDRAGHGRRAAAAAARDPHALPVRRDRRRILLARRPGGDAPGRSARRALLGQGAGQRHPYLGRAARRRARRSSKRARRRPGCSRSAPR